MKLWRGQGVSCCFETWHKIQAEGAEWNCEGSMIFGCKVILLHAKVQVSCTFRNNVFGSMFFVLIFGILVEKWIPQLLLEADF